MELINLLKPEKIEFLKGKDWTAECPADVEVKLEEEQEENEEEVQGEVSEAESCVTHDE